MKEADDRLQRHPQELDCSLLDHLERSIAVQHSSINHLDSLALSGRKGVTPRRPLIPGVDLGGRVQQPGLAARHQLVLNGAGLGEELHGGLAQRATAKGPNRIEERRREAFLA
ncbi:MAG: hypothetical protein HY829_11970 [Actinobacteria bacterium]|nr:hypothetical protein [Actinomycetota bacterium]